MNASAFELVRKDITEVFTDASSLKGLRGETVLVTGGTGFMGAWLLEALAYLNDRHSFGTKVAVLSRGASAFKAARPWLGMRGEFTFIDKDVRDVVELPEVQYVVHAAANPDNRQHSSDPLRVVDVVTKGTEAVLSASARMSGMKKFLYVSSGLVYGPQPMEVEAIPESYSGGMDPASAMSVYPESKRLAETLCAAYRSQFKMPVVIARPFAFIGPYQLLDKPWAINNFISDALRGGPIGILGDERTVRSYMYPSDMALWLLTMLAAGSPGSVYNVGSPVPVTLRELAGKVASNFTPEPAIELAGANRKGGGRSRFVPDVGTATRNLGLTLKVGLDEAIRKTLLWHKTAGV